MMYEVEVFTKVREVYLVEADSPEAAKVDWIDGDLISSECQEVEDVGTPKETED